MRTFKKWFKIRLKFVQNFTSLIFTGVTLFFDYDNWKVHDLSCKGTKGGHI